MQEAFTISLKTNLGNIQFPNTIAHVTLWITTHSNRGFKHQVSDKLAVGIAF